jgi:hypothetical protein
MNNAYLNCNIFSVHTIDQPYANKNFFLICSIYFYNSLTSGIFNFDPECIQIPEFEIKDTYLLKGLDFDLISNNYIPILYKDEDTWKIDLRLYEDFKLQSRNI